MDNDIKKLITELEMEGAGKKEAEELALISKNLSNFGDFERSFDAKIKFLNQVSSKNTKRFEFNSAILATFIAIILFVGFATVVSAQDSLPGQPLYVVKRATEKLIGSINPSFKGEILIRRSNEIKKLSNPENKNINDLTNTIKAYEDELNTKIQLNTKEMEKTVRNLEDAKRSATDGSKMEIEHILRQTQERQETEHEEDDNFNRSTFEQNDDKSFR